MYKLGAAAAQMGMEKEAIPGLLGAGLRGARGLYGLGKFLGGTVPRATGKAMFGLHDLLRPASRIGSSTIRNIGGAKPQPIQQVMQALGAQGGMGGQQIGNLMRGGVTQFRRGAAAPAVQHINPLGMFQAPAEWLTGMGTLGGAGGAGMYGLGRMMGGQ